MQIYIEIWIDFDPNQYGVSPKLFWIQAILVVISPMINIHVIIMFQPELARQLGVGGDKVIWSSRSQQIYLIARLQLLEQKLS